VTAPVQYYVDPSINANSGTGTIGDPYGDLQYALNTITRSTTVGDQINVKAGTAENMTSAITLATYGTPQKLIIRGYTSAAGDGGIGEINFGGNNTNIFAGTYTDVILWDMKIGNNGTGQHNFGGSSGAYNCELHTFSGYVNVSSSNSFLCRSKIVCSNSNYAILFGYSGPFINQCYIEYTGGGTGIYLNGSNCFTLNNIIKLSSAGARGIYCLHTVGNTGLILGNSIYQSAAGTGSGIDIDTRNEPAFQVIANNLIQGFSGSGGTAIKINASNTRDTGVVRNNRWFNCTNGYAGTDALQATDNSATLASPFTDAANGDYRPTSEVAAIGWPSDFYGLANSNNYLALGALQKQAAAAGGANRLINGGLIIG